MAKEENYTPGDQEIFDLDQIAQNCIPNRSEIVSIHSDKLNRTVHISRDDVYKAASVMASNNQVAALFGIDRKTMAKHFSKELDMARAFAKQKLLTRFYHLAVYGNSPADRIFALKNYAGLSDQGMVEELGEMDEGVEFKVKRPVKPIDNTLPTNSLEHTENNLDTEDSDEVPRI